MRYRGIARLLAVSLVLQGVGLTGWAAEPGAVQPAATPVSTESASRSTERRTQDPAEVAADALVVRPVSLAATAVGAAIYLVALPFAAIAGDVKGPARTLVGAPAKFTFRRPLGSFDQ